MSYALCLFAPKLLAAKLLFGRPLCAQAHADATLARGAAAASPYARFHFFFDPSQVGLGTCSWVASSIESDPVRRAGDTLRAEVEHAEEMLIEVLLPRVCCSRPSFHACVSVCRADALKRHSDCLSPHVKVREALKVMGDDRSRQVERVSASYAYV